MNFSLEIGPHTDLETLPSVKDVYVTMLPGGDYKETANQVDELVKASNFALPSKSTAFKNGNSLVLSPK